MIVINIDDIDVDFRGGQNGVAWFSLHFSFFIYKIEKITEYDPS